LLTFGQFRQLLDSGDEYFPLLFLTATNLGTRELELFDSSDPRFSNVPVARAVRASAGFPWFFRPVEIALPDPEDPDERAVHCFVDGGVICNFPAYIFARRVLRERFERSLEGIYRPYAMRPWLNVGLRLTDTTRSETDPGRFRTFAGVTAGMKKLLSEGTRTYLETLLAESTVERLFSIGQPFAETGWDDNLLAFDKLSPALVRDMYDRGRAFARSKFSQLQFRGPPPDEIEPRMAELIETALRVFGLLEGNAGLMLRASLFVPREFELVLEYRANMNDLRDTDRDLRFDFEQGLVGLCFNRRRPLVCNLRQFKAALDDGEMNPLHSLGLDAGIQSRVREDRTWLMSVPVFDPTTADPDPFGDEPEISDEGRHFAELDTPLDGALFGVLSLDGGFEYGTIDMPEEVERQVIDLRVLALRDIMVAAAWDIGKIFDAYFAAVPPAFDTEEPTHGE